MNRFGVSITFEINVRLSVNKLSVKAVLDLKSHSLSLAHHIQINKDMKDNTKSLFIFKNYPIKNIGTQFIVSAMSST